MKVKEPLISVIVPVYKVEAYLHRCIDSILAQTLRDIELILVDDGSPDGSGFICDEYSKKDSRVRVIHKPNGGVSSARNTGIEAALGEWLCFVDSDDYIDETYLESFGMRNKVADMYMQGYIVEDSSSQILADHSFGDTSKKDFSDILAESEEKNIINSPCFKLYKKAIVKRNHVTFDINTSYGEDHLFSLNYLIFIDSIIVSRTSGYHYLMHEQESLTRRQLPIKMQMYYILKSRDYCLKMQNKYNSDILKETYNRRLVSNCKILINSMFHQNVGLKQYSDIQKELKNTLKKYESGTSVKDKLFYMVFFHLPTNTSRPCNFNQ